MRTPTVRIHVEGGCAFVDQVPAGISVEVVDFDVAPDSTERDEAGRPCSRYTVDSMTLVPVGA